jgi:hypothetical protein
MKFPYQKVPIDSSEAFPEKKTILRPIVPILLEFKGIKTGYWTLIDSGADYCFFHSEIAEILQLDWRKGKMQEFGGIGGERSLAYFHKINIHIGGWQFELYCGFSDKIAKFGYGVLGQVGFFDHFVVKFDLEKEEIEIKPRK